MTRAEQVTEPLAGHGEGPSWFATESELRWVDMLVGDILQLRPGDGTVVRRHVAGVVAAIRPRRGGGMVLGVERGFALTTNDDDSVLLLPPLWADASIRMNDGACDARGRFYCGTLVMAPPAHRGVLYRLDPDGTTSIVVGGLDVSNGLAWNASGDSAFYVDSATQRIDRFSVDASGELVERRPVVQIPPERGTPDGLCLDADGGIWVALWDGAAVHRYSPEGTLEHVIRLPVARPTACTFGGDDLGDLYITTSRPTDAEGSDGALFVARTGARGFPDHTFAG